MQKNLLKAAKAVLAQNWTGQFTTPSPALYPQQWNWDSGFIAIGYARYDLKKAESELRSLLEGQWTHGMVPHRVFRTNPAPGNGYFPGSDFWKSQLSPDAPPALHTSGITMPPVHAFIAWHIYKLAENKAKARALLKEIFPRMVAFHRYLHERRDLNGEGLVYIKHPWEAGMENSPAWDAPLSRIPQAPELVDEKNVQVKLLQPAQTGLERFLYLADQFKKYRYGEAENIAEEPFLIQDPLFNSILIQSTECLIQMAGLLGEDASELIFWHESSIHAMNEKLWNENTGLYDAFDLKTGERIPMQSISGFMPLFAGIPTVEQAEFMVSVLRSEMFGNNDADTAFMCPTYNLQAKEINYTQQWRGPVSVNLNWLLYKGLYRYYFIEEAEAIKNDTLYLLSKYGFYEYFDSRKSIKENGAYGFDNYSWSAALCIDLLLDPGI